MYTDIFSESLSESKNKVISNQKSSPSLSDTIYHSQKEKVKNVQCNWSFDLIKKKPIK